MSKDVKKPVVIVDGSSYLFRAYHALPPLTNKEGMPTGAIYGVINMLRKLQSTLNPEHLVVIFDTKGKNFRHELYPQYKANRPPMPDELGVQIEPLHAVIEAMGLPLIKQEGLEADDIIGTFAKQAEKEGYDVIISTGDKDFAQLINDKITLVNTMSDSLLNVETVVDKFGVKAEQIVDYLTLMGDTVDNVPGVHKCGPKTAAKWLVEYGTLDNLIAHQSEIKGKIGEYFREAIPNLALSKTLVTIKTDLQIPLDFLSLEIKQPDVEQLKHWFTKLQFKTWLKQLDELGTTVLGPLSSESSSAAPTSGTANDTISHVSQTNLSYECILDEETLKGWVAQIKQAKRFAVDTETNSLDAHQATLVGISICVVPNRAAYIPIAHDYEGAPNQLPLSLVLSYLSPLLLDKDIIKIGQNLKYDMHVFYQHGIKIQEPIEDTMVASYVINSTTSHDMGSLAQIYLDKPTIAYEDIAGKGAKQKTFNLIDIEAATRYSAEDADITLQLHLHFEEMFKTEQALKSVYDSIERPLVSVLARMERLGVKIDEAVLAQQSVEVGAKIAEIEANAHELAEEDFNLSSPKQLQSILYDKLKLPVLKKTPTGQPSTAEDVLADLSHQYELPKLILKHRSLSKLKSTYIDALPLQVNPKSHRIHTSYRQAVTATGRLSSTDPNLQNIPIRTEEGRKIRTAFVAMEDFVLVSADYSQIELRIMAHLCKDEGLVKAFMLGEDIHKFTAHEIFGVSLDEVTSEQRRRAKAINFGLIYGMSAFGLSAQLGIDRKDAAAYMEQYFHRYPKVKEFMNETKDKAFQDGFVQTLFHRKLYLKDIQSKNPMLRQAAQRAAINAPMQGTAADIIKKAMIKVDDWIESSMAGKVKMTMQVHDELVFEVHNSVLEEAKTQIKALMESAVTLDVPLIVEVGAGKSWDIAH